MRKETGAFTLVELIVSVTIIMVLTGVGAMSLNNFNSAKELESVRDEVSTHLKLARNLAITKQLPDSILGLDYVRVNFSNNDIIITGVAGTTDHTSSPYSTKTINKKGGLIVTSSSDFGFSKSTGTLTTSTGLDTTMAVVVSVTRGTDTKTININNSGVITNVDTVPSDEKTRDSQRITDLNRILAALIAMKQASGGTGYPAPLNRIQESGYIDEIPLDPKDRSKYCYFSANPPVGFLGALMEDVGSTNYPYVGSLIGGYNTTTCRFNFKLMLPP